MEEFFKQPFLDILYDSLSIEFEEKLLNDKNEYKKYHDIIGEEEKLQNMLKEIVGQDEEKLKKLMGIIREIEYYCCKETEYWNKKYFKLGFTYMFQFRTQVEETRNITIQENQQDKKSFLVHNFLKELRENKVNKEKKNRFFAFLKKLDVGTELQKRRFCLYYDIDKKEEKKATFESIAKKERCTNEAAAYSIKRFTNLLINLKEEEDIKQLLEIIENK